MSTLLLRLAGPLQSWGDDSKFKTRRTYSVPTKSGVVGMLAAALGLPRTADQDIQHLSESLKMGIRVDQPGEIIEDYHVMIKPHAKTRNVSNVTRRLMNLESTTKTKKVTDVSKREYLSDAIFTVGLESKDINLLKRLDYALHHPVYPLFLGRRACPPTLPLALGIRNTALVPSLQNEPWQAADWRQKQLDSDLRLVVETSNPGSHPFYRLKDVPLSYSPIHRRYAYRCAAEWDSVQIKNDPIETEHDAFSELR